MKTIAGVSADIIAGSGDNSPASTEILSTPAGIWIDLNGNLYVCIEVEYTIRKISSDGIISTIIGRPNSRSFDGASGLGVETPTSGVMSVYGDRNGTYLYFSDGAYFLWRYSFIEGIVSRYAGDIPANAGFDGDGGPATSAVLNTPMGLFLSSVGILYFADQGNNRIRMIDTSTGIINTFAGSGSMGFSGDNGPATDAELNYPQSVWGNSMGVIFITDMNNNRIRQVEGNIITTYAGTGSTAYSGNGPVTLTTFSLPTDIKGDSNGNMYIIDSGSCSVRFIDYSSNFIILIAGTGSCGISSTSVNLATSSPLYNDEYSGLTVDTVGNIFTSEYNANFIRLFTTFLSNSPTIAPTMTPTVSPTVFPSLLPTVLPSASAFPTINPTSSTKYYLATIAGNGTAASTGDNGPATLASINQPYGIWGDSNDNLFICEYGSYVIRKISSSGIITKLIGTGITSTSGASGPALSLNLERPVSIYGDDRSGTLFFGGDKYWIMRYNMTSNYVSRYVGALPGVQAFSGDEGLSVNARINNPRGLYYTSNGILYITDHLNHRIRYVNVTTGIITTIVGNGTGIFYGENISASLSCINSPRMVWLNSLGIIYIADSINYRIRSVDLNGIIRTVAGTGRSTPYNGDNQPATLANLNIPYDAKTDTVGTLYIMEYNGCRLRFVNPVGIIGTLIGSTTCGVATTNVQLVTPSTVIGKVYYFWINSLGFLYLAESENNYIRKVYYDLPPTITPTPAPSLLPSITPSVIPTVQPSSKPSNNPTDIPTIFPTLCPSDVPTVQPSVSPTTTPTSAPSAGPSFDPTLLPTIDPTCFPTVAPSDVPTVHPTLCPSISPSTQPTILPSSSTQYYLTTIAGLGTPVRSGDDGPASSASVNMPFGLWGDSNDNLFICESGSSVVRKISSGGIITTLIGTGVSSTNGLDDLASSINIESPISITGAQSNGNLFIAGNFYFIWKYNSTSKYVRRIAGTLPATRSFTGDNGPAKNATINSPRGLFYCSNGILYFADRLNHRIRTINVTTGIMKTFVGDGIARFIGENGPASLASLNSPRSVWLDTLGVAFIVDSTNHRIRSVGLDGIIRTVAGTGIDSFNGDHQPATLANLNIPYDAKTDTVGNLYIMEYNGCRLRFVNPAGIIGTLIGSTTCGTATTNVQLVTPSTVIGSSPSFWVNSLGFIYFTEDSKHYVRKLYFNLPSASPTMPPTFVPSTLPSMFPSVLPSFEPSTAPTIIPSAIPSFPPTDLPSPSPSAVPSSIPSYPPSHQPSIIPTAIPSDQPTDSPTLIPSSVSSFSSPNPSANPTRTPSSNPSILNSSPDEITLTVNSSNWKQVLSFLGVYSSSEVILASLDPSRMDTNTTSFVMFGSKDLQSSSDSIVVSSSFPYSSSYPVTRISSSYHRDSISRSAVMVGDMNGDRLSDLVVCYPLASRCLMFFGKEEALSRVGVGVTLTGQATMRYDYFGFAVSGVGDVNGDGLEDVIISAITGKVCYVIYGRSTASAFAWPSELKMADVVSGETGHKIVGDGKMVLVGISVAGVGDMNGDGLNEVALSIMSSSGSALQRYVVYVLFGVSVGGEGDVMLSSTGVVNNGFRVYGEEGYYTGFSISGGGDMNGDGLSELLIGGIVYPVSGVDVRRGERGYVVLGRRGRYDDVMLGNGSSLSSYGVKIEGGGGFIVTGIGDVNDDGYDDMMLLSSVDYIRQSNAYLVSYAGSMTSVPSLIPSSWPSSEPSSDPSKLPSSYSPSMLSSEQPTNSPSIGRPQPPTVPSPTIQPTRRPTTSPSHRGSAKPTSASPIQTRVPSLRPSLIPTLTPTIIQTIRSPTKHPSERPSRTPTTIPTVRGSPIPTVSLPAVLLPLSEYAARYVNYSSLNKQGIVYGEDGVNEIFYISSLSSDGKSRSGWSGTIIGGRGRKVYVIYPKDPIQPVNRIVLGDFNESVDVIDVSHIRGIGSLSDVSYLTHPLTLFLPDNQKIVISSYESMKELSETNFIFDSSSSSYSDVSVGGEENLWLSMSFIFPVCLLGICLLGVGYVSMLNNEKKRKTDLLLTDKMLEEDGSRVKPSVDIKEDIIPSSVESEKHSIHHSRPSLYKNSEEEEGAISMSDSLDTNDYEISLVNMSEEEEGIAHSESHEASSSHSSSDDCFF